MKGKKKKNSKAFSNKILDQFFKREKFKVEEMMQIHQDSKKEISKMNLKAKNNILKEFIHSN